MSQSADLYSVRLVIADFYFEKPTPGLDLCYSEFRGSAIKKVPIIRVFGSNSHGQKTCTHVHGVFPYFYVPYESKNFESLNKAIYQIAFSLDKALNVSLGQGSSPAHHVFKIQLVKGIPFYGYHRSEHHYLKIYMYNPRFVRRAANLLQNGSILGKVFHPHESHVPYVLQFMIDYNLYGMSFMHVPLEVVKFRRKDDLDILNYPNLKSAQILSATLVKKQSCCALEADIGANFILNRFQMAVKNVANKHSNPGVEAIWHDENLRRQKLIQSFGEDEEKANTIPRLEVPATQERPHVEITESEIFYRVGLISKLDALEQSLSGSGSLLDQTLNSSSLTLSQPNVSMNVGNVSNKEMRRVFNLKKLLVNSVYPEECSSDENLVNASCIENHLSGKSIFHISDSKSNEDSVTNSPNNTLVDESAFLEDTIIDEELIMSLSQEQHIPLDASLRAEDLELLHVMQQLEEEGENNNRIDLDSSLAPLSQSHKDFKLTPEMLDKEIVATVSQHLVDDNESESENEDNSNMHDFSMALDDIDELLLKISQSQTEKNTETIQSNTTNVSLAQLDGVDDFLSKTPEKLRRSVALKRQQITPPSSPKTPKRNGSLKSPQRSPRTPKQSAASKYAPLPIVFSNRSVSKKLLHIDHEEPSSQPKCLNFGTPGSPVPLHKKLAITKMRRKTISSAKELLSLEQKDEAAKVDERTSISTPRRTRKTSIDLDKTHITCALTPRRKSERLLKTCKVNEVKNMIAKETTKQLKRKTEQQQEEKSEVIKKITKEKIKTPSTVKTRNESKISKEAPVIQKLMVRVPRKNLKKIAAEFQKERELQKATTISVSSKSIEKHSERTEMLNVLERDNNLQDQDTNEVDNIGTNLSELISLFQKNSGSESKSSEMPALRISQEVVELVEIQQERPCEVQNTSETAASNDNIRKNLSQLTRMFQELDDLENTKRVPEVYSESKSTVNHDDLEEVIAESDTESTPNVSKSKRTPYLRRIRRSLVSKSILKTPKTPKTPTSNLCDLTMSVNSPSVFSEYSSPALTPKISPVNEDIVIPLAQIDRERSEENKALIFAPACSPPTREYTIKTCEKLQIYEYDFQRPFYGHPEDITKAKEVGFTVLQIPGNKLSDCPEFQSVLGGNITGLASWRRLKLKEIGGTQALQRYKTTERMREFFATKKQVIVEPHLKPPTRHEAKIWVKARELLQNQDEASKRERLQIGEDSPIKIHRKKVTMMFSDDAADGGNDADDMDCTSCSLTLTPLTPATPVLQKKELEPPNSSQTPLTSNCESSAESKNNARSASHRRSKRFKSIKTSLNEKLKAAADKEMQHDHDSKNDATIAEPLESLSSSQQSNRSTDESSSVSSQVALAELDRSSFVKRLKAGEVLNKKAQLDVSFGLTSTSLNNTFGFKVNLENLHEAKADIECNFLTTIVMELFVPTRGDLYPNPAFDEIRCIFYAIDNNIPEESLVGTMPQKACGYILVNDLQDIIQHEGKIHGLDADIEVKIVKTEIEALEALLALCAKWDADIYAGYEIEMSSWGYVVERAKFLTLDIAPLLSRVPSQKMRDFVDEEREPFGHLDLDVEMKLCGRILLDVWRLMRSEIALTSYTFENVMYHILHKRCPWHSYRELTTWFAAPCSRWIVLEYYLERVRGILALLDQLDLLGRTSEMAKLIGIQFYEVLSRGSQFRVESMMLRIAKPRNLVPLSPSVQQRAHMRAPEYLPLILEPQSRFYADPVIVLDFQSLYPSMIIGYNYCFSTCLGRVEHLGNSAPFEFGASQLRVSPKMLRKLIDEDLVNISPCGVVFVKASVREGILPRMLTEILDTRQMVKQSMKLHKSNSALQRILHSRQLGLKLMANVTYGYTAANFSGRMPAVEVGDSVVAKGRETLERTIKMVEANEKWGVKVVYGDTDSLFVQVPGRNREQAFKIGEEIAAEATKVNPHPVKLKLEKVYQPCILQTKKRYVGYMYETADQTEPVYEAKGIETVRRDGCPAVAKMLEKVLRILFETTDVSQVKQYVCRQFTKLLSGRANIQDLIFAKEFRGLNGYKPTACVPALEMTRKWIQSDPRRIPRAGERVPFIITNGPPGVPLIRLIRSPHEVLADAGLKINAIYYITKAIIPALNRCLLLIGADVNEWFANLPRKILMTPALSAGNEVIAATNQQQQKKSTISQYFSTTNCIIDCGRQTKDGICNVCMREASKCVITLEAKIAQMERAFHLTQYICQACCGRVGDLKCGSLDCPVLYVLENKKRDLKQIDYFKKLLEKF